MYTFAPLANINTLDDHFGFYVIAIGMFVFWMIMITTCRDDLEGAGWTTVVMILFVGVVGLISWNSGEYKVYQNTEVTGEFVGYVAEGFNIAEYQGKYSRRVDKHFTYVVYKVDGNNIMLQCEVGKQYPQFVTLYKN